MNLTYLIVVLFLMTAFAVLVYAIRSKEQFEQLRRDPNSPDPTLSKGSPGDRSVEHLDR